MIFLIPSTNMAMKFLNKFKLTGDQMWRYGK